MYVESGLNYIQVGTLLDLETYLTSRHEYIIADGVIYERVGRGKTVVRIKGERKNEK